MTIISRARVGYKMIDQANEAYSAELAVTNAKGIVVFIEIRDIFTYLTNFTSQERLESKMI